MGGVRVGGAGGAVPGAVGGLAAGPVRCDDLDAVAHLLDLDPSEVDAALAGGPGGDAGLGGFRLDPGDMVVFTGEMAEPRSVWEQRAEAAGLV